jgi:hypothetical protein
MQKGRIKMSNYVLFDVKDMDVDSELNNIVEMHDSYCREPYLIMSKMTFKLIRMLSKWYSDKDNSWIYDGEVSGVPYKFQIAIDKSIPFGEVKVK